MQNTTIPFSRELNLFSQSPLDNAHHTAYTGHMRDTILAGRETFRASLPHKMAQDFKTLCKKKKRTYSNMLVWIVRGYIRGHLKLVPPEWGAALALLREVYVFSAELYMRVDPTPEERAKMDRIMVKIKLLEAATHEQ